ncbi:hypothetical protein [Cupriavidus lacunae]|uniref:hypothetical protein n=1 Tax=Cupriavidus lacunae TaxID=2666307 RepID=UPI0031344D10
MLSLMSDSVVPDLASSSLSIKSAQTENAGIVMSQLGWQLHDQLDVPALSGRLDYLPPL